MADIVAACAARMPHHDQPRVCVANSLRQDAAMHRIRAKLYPNYLPTGGEGTYVARTQSEAVLSVEEVCAAATTRGGAVNSAEVMATSVNGYLNEALYQLSDGFAVGNKLLSVHPRLGGVFDKLGNIVHPSKHKVGFAFRAGSALREAEKTITVEIDGLADTNGFIGQVQDIDSETNDSELSVGGNIVILGHKIKVEGDDSTVGVYFVNQSDGARVKVAKHLAENRDAKIIAVAPALASGTYRVEIVTQYAKGGTPLKEPRTIHYGVDLAVH
ncbi:MAG: hypothetical protein Ta2A_04290 [Treponemataceae bacterium]|nr:MAG: hypothetical protein Ta2A_04290 [Treponemataceae bacterium]